MRKGKKESLRNRVLKNKPVDEIRRLKIKGTGTAKSRKRHDKICCPVCWSKDYTFLYAFWSSGDAVSKCNNCKHHFIPEFTHPGKFSNLTKSKIDRSYQKEMSSKIIKLVREKMTSKKEIKIFFPFMTDDNLLTYLTRKPRPSLKNRNNVQEEIEAMNKFKFYSLWNSNKVLRRDEQKIRNNFTYGYVDMGFDKTKAFHSRDIIISKGIKDMSNKHGKFDIAIIEGTLSRLLDPDPVIQSILSNTNYFIFVEKVTTSQKMLEYGYQINEDMREMTGYPLKESKWEKLYDREQLQFFSQESLRLLFKFSYEKLPQEDQPKGKYRSFKNEKMSGQSDHFVFCHNFPKGILTS